MAASDGTRYVDGDIRKPQEHGAQGGDDEDPALERAGINGASPKDVILVLDEHGLVIERHIKRRAVGMFTLPGLLKIKAVRKSGKKGAQGISPFTREEITVAAKPAAAEHSNSRASSPAGRPERTSSHHLAPVFRRVWVNVFSPSEHLLRTVQGVHKNGSTPIVSASMGS